MGPSFASSKIRLYQCCSKFHWCAPTVVYRKVTRHAFDLVQLPTREKVSSVAATTNVMAEQVRFIQEEIIKKLEQSNANYKVAVHKHIQEVLTKGDMVMVPASIKVS